MVQASIFKNYIYIYIYIRPPLFARKIAGQTLTCPEERAAEAQEAAAKRITASQFVQTCSDGAIQHGGLIAGSHLPQVVFMFAELPSGARSSGLSRNQGI